MAIAWADCSFTEAQTDAQECSLDVEDADRRFQESSLASSGLQYLDEWLMEDPIDSKEKMKFADLFPGMLEEEVDCSFPRAMDDESACDALTGESTNMDMNLIDLSKDDQESEPLNLTNFSDSPSAIASDTVSIAKSAEAATADWKKIIVNKPILDKAVERLGGGKSGAMKLWKLIQVWLKHRNPENGMPASAFTGCRDTSVHTITSNQQEMVEDLPCLSSNADMCCQNNLLIDGSSNPSTDVVSSLLEDITSFNQSCIASTVLDPSNLSLGSLCLPTEQKAKVVDQPSVQEDAAVGDGLASVPIHDTCEGWTSSEIAPPYLPLADAATGAADMSIWLCTAAAHTKAARKNRMARQRRSLANNHVRLGRRAKCSPCQCLHSPRTHSNCFKSHRNLQSMEAQKSEKSMRHFFQKVLKPSEGGNLGRTDIPKKGSDIHLPNLRAKRCVSKSPNDMNSGYKYWLQQKFKNGGSGTVGCNWVQPNKSHMQLIKATGDSMQMGFVGKDHKMLDKKRSSALGEDVIPGQKAFQIVPDVAPSNFPSNECAPKLDKPFREAVTNKGSSFSIACLLPSEVGKVKNSLYAEGESLETSAKDEASMGLASTITTNVLVASGSDQLPLDSLMEDIMEEFENDSPLMGRFPSLDFAAMAQFDEILELHNAAASECSSNHAHSSSSCSHF